MSPRASAVLAVSDRCEAQVIMSALSTRAQHWSKALDGSGSWDVVTGGCRRLLAHGPRLRVRVVGALGAAPELAAQLAGVAGHGRGHREPALDLLRLQRAGQGRAAREERLVVGMRAREGARRRPRRAHRLRRRVRSGPRGHHVGRGVGAGLLRRPVNVVV
eukprot:1888529-Rhodomonas_salina.2